MTDTTNAPPAAAPEPAPQAQEVPINQNPTNQPNPLGSQAPDKPVGDLKGSEHRPQSRREAIQAAFDRASNPPPKSKPAEAKAAKEAKPADAKPGHNQPPEQTPQEGIDLKRRPSDQPRSEKGTFAPRQAVKDDRSPDPQQSPEGVRAAQRANPLPDHAPFREPPPRFSEPGKQEWAAAPESVRADVYRMHREYQGAYEQYRGAAEAFRPIARFHQMAQQYGTTLEQALTNYTGIETKLRADPVAGLDNIVHNLGLTDPETGRRITLRDIAYHVLSQSPEALKVMQQGNQQTAAQHQIGALHREVTGLKQHLQQMHAAQQFSYTRSQVDQFASQHPRFDELGPLIEQELKLGFDIDTAYRRAELLAPATQAAQTRTASAQTRNIDRSISGAPDAGPSNGTSRPKGPPPSRRDAIQNAIRRVNGSM
jgi:hypothetical protein